MSIAKHEELTFPYGLRFYRRELDGLVTWHSVDPAPYVSPPSHTYAPAPWSTVLEEVRRLRLAVAAGSIDVTQHGCYFRLAGLDVLFHRYAAETWPRWFEVTETGEVACSPQLAGALERAWTGPLYPLTRRA